MKNFQLLSATFLLIICCACSSTKNTDSFPVKKDNGVLYDNTWQLEYMSGIRIAFEGLFPDKKPEITFDEIDKLVRGNAGCNGYSATYTKEGDQISFGDPGPSTMMYCGEGEQQFLAMMKKINRFSVDSDGKLNLMIDDIPMMRFHKL
ncbi:MAG: META domain-containing protein [Gelidibacter sp.]